MFYILTLCIALSCLVISKNLIHFFQLESYQFPSFYRTVLRNPKYSAFPFVSLGIANIIIYLVFEFSNNAILNILLISSLLIISLIIRKNFIIKNTKKPLIKTGRLKRLYTMYILVMILSALLCIKIDIVFLLPFLSFFIFLVAALLAWPIEKIINELYFNDAKRMLNNMPNLIKIGITGSYGKTSVKTIIGNILSEKYTTLISPKSFNTPMGLTITIRDYLKSYHRIFVAEMGSRHIGDIKKLCKLVNPQIGIITSIGPQHLDTFKNISNVSNGKYELIEALPSDGHAFFQDDQNICLDLYNKTSINKTLISIYDENADYYGFDIMVSNLGSKFKLKLNNGIIEEIETLLLGEHNIKNILLAVAVCSHLGLNINIIKNSIKKIKPLPARLEMISVGKYTVINDGFNSNLIGANEAVKVLSKFDGRKIIITPGMVELGEQEFQINKEFGKQMANVANFVILVGNNRIRPIKEGLLENGFNSSNIYSVKSFNESTSVLSQIVAEGDVVLYENDLPDNYIEA